MEFGRTSPGQALWVKKQTEGKKKEGLNEVQRGGNIWGSVGDETEFEPPGQKREICTQRLSVKKKDCSSVVSAGGNCRRHDEQITENRPVSR